jgi:magnesium transporter
MAITFFDLNDKGLPFEVSDAQNGKWLSLHHPTAAELQLVGEKWGLPEDFLTDPLDQDEAPRVEAKDGFTLIIFRLPITNDESGITYKTVPIGIILSKDISIIVSMLPIHLFKDYFRPANLSDFPIKRNALILSVIETVTQKYLQYLRHINRMQDQIENQLIKDTQNEKLINLLHLKKSLVIFTTSLKGNNSILYRLKKNLKIVETEEEGEILEDIVIDLKQAIEMSEIYTNIIMGTMNTFSSIISNQISFIMKVLTGFTIILMIPTLITSAYGMNIEGLPFAKSEEAFAIVMSICLFFSFSSLAFLKYKKWF